MTSAKKSESPGRAGALHGYGQGVTVANRVRGVLERLLGRWHEVAAADAVSDAELLRRFADGGDAAAFELLVWRHGAMVLGVCRRAVRDEQLAEDAFQAAFLVLARKARAVRGGNVAGWLFRVARRVAARASRNCPAVVELRDRAAPPSPCPVEERELAALLDAEVARLPDRLRRPVVLCYLGGRTTEDAARELGCPRGTVLSRLAAARKTLADRLARRGVAPPAVLAASAVGVSNRLVTAATTAAAAFRLGTHPVTTASALATGVCTAMNRVTLFSVVGGVALAAGLATGVGLVAAQGSKPAGVPDAVAAADPPPLPRAADQPADRAEKLRKQSDELARRAEQLQARIEREAPATADTVDTSVLQSALFALDRDVLTTEQQVKAARRRVERAEKELEEARKQPITQDAITYVIDNDEAVVDLSTKLGQAKQALARARASFNEGAPARVKAEQEHAALEARLKARRDAVAEGAEATVHDKRERQYRAHVRDAKEVFDTAAGLLEDIHEQRDKLIKRIATQKQAGAKRRHTEDELRVLRQIQLELFRQRTLAELGVEGLPAPPPAQAEADPRLEAQLKGLRREVEALRGELEKLKKK